MPKPLKLILLYGGKSGEHEISLISAASVLSELNPQLYDIIPIGMDKEGRFFLNQYKELLTYKKQLPVTTAASVPLPDLMAYGHLAIEADVVFPMVHGPLYEDGCLQGLLSLANVAFVGCGVLPSAIGMDKDMARRVVAGCGVPFAKYQVLSWHSSSHERELFCEKAVNTLGLPLFVKPCSLGSSVGIHKVKHASELRAAVDDALHYDEEILVEEFIEGREIELAVLENQIPTSAPLVSVPGEIKVHHADGFYSYVAKYIDSDSTELCAPAVLPEATIARLQQMAAAVFVQLKCKGMARVDFFVNDKTQDIYFNEINTLPGFTPISMYPRLWQVSGVSYAALLENLIQLALTHQGCRDNRITSYQ